MIHRYIIEATDEVKGFEEAIERLDREWGIEELEPCDDYISREQAKSDYADWYGYGYSDNTFYKHLCSMPPVTPQPKTGHWSRKTKVDAYDIAGVKTWGIKCQCDRCDFTTIVVEDFGYYKYCPNCGAKMESEESDDIEAMLEHLWNATEEDHRKYSEVEE